MNRLKLIILIMLIGFAHDSIASSSVWKVEKAGKVLYLGGTLHVLTKQDFPLPGEYEQAFNAAEKLVLEADVHLMSDPQVVREVQDSMLYHDGRTLLSVLSPDVYRKLDDYLRKNGTSAALFNTVTAGSMSMTVTLMEMQKMGISEQGVDQIYYGKAEQKNKPVAFLETLSDQINFIAHMGEGIEDELITSTVEDMGELPSYMKQMVIDWRKGDVAALETTALQDMKDYPSVYESILLSRNQAWLPQIEHMLETDEVEAVFVGVLHLIGEDGLLEQLKQRGYTVSQL